MTEESHQSIPEPQMGQPVIEPNVVSPAPSKPSKNLWIILGIVVALICLCSIACIALVTTGIGKVMVERAPVEGVIDTFMKAMEAKDVDSAYSLISPRAQRQISVEDVRKMIEGNNYVLFEGYQSLSVQNLNLTVTANTNPDLPQGTVANVDGYISYSDGFTGSFEAILEKVDRQWMIHRINIVVPPDKFQP